MSKAKAPKPGVFAKGPDPRRHVFTQEERSRGYKSTFAKYQARGLYATLWLHYQAKRCRKRKREPKEGGKA
jgi:hypothetical protein